MAVRVEIHSTAKRAFQVIGFTLTLCGLALGLRHLRNRDDPAQRAIEGAPARVAAITAVDLTPVVTLSVPSDSVETTWSTALATTLNGQTEAKVQAGRVDVLTDRFAIEVERLPKWHEAIGQALHYSDQTGKLPCIALIVEPDSWPLPAAVREKIQLIEDTAQKRGIRVFLLRRALESP